VMGRGWNLPRWIGIPVAACLATGLFVFRGLQLGGLGFPLDDAWIHQTYARNLAETGQLAYLPGQPSAGSTSPAWSFLLSVGYLLGVDYRLWAYLLGGLALAATVLFAYRLAGRLGSRQPAAALLTGLFCAVEWHLVWAAVSGMETMLFTALSLALLDYYLLQANVRQGQTPDRPASLQREQGVVNSVGIGLLGGILVLTRPEGLILAGLVIGGLAIYPRPRGGRALRWRAVETLVSLASLGLLLAPYLAFNQRTAGALFPNTFYAKQAEYAVYLKSVPIWTRFWHVLTPPLVGAQVLLLPGFGYAVYHLIRQRRWPALLPLAWWAAFLAAYALRLPVNYQHGRYTMPTIPVFILYGTWGTAGLLRPRAASLAWRVLSRAAPPALALLALLFWMRGALVYRDDVGFIGGEMVAVAHWLNDNTPPDALIAVHDIGAVGYLTDRPLLDLAGLITPEVIPFITDADRLAEWMIDEGADYAVFFPDFSATYAQLAADPRFQPVYCTDYAWTRDTGHKNLCVYLLQK
jgi:hypothetical protein